MQKNELEEIRCCRCGKLLAKGRAEVMEFKCPRCGAFTLVRAKHPSAHLPVSQGSATIELSYAISRNRQPTGRLGQPS